MNNSVQTLSNSYQNHPGLPRNHPMYLSDGRCNSSSAEAGVLVRISGHDPIPAEGGTHYQRQNASPIRYCTHHRSETPLAHPMASHSRLVVLTTGTKLGKNIIWFLM
ncbi:hypothetical protein AVEN_105086-1 [Araneus ventricosus]|uniref:Uncharacterized protein n=1 Tax=Araneus ventricosus TaxID=182803 RepID=A0A4Y2GTU6_ARAVE|nr:hypothetical protein AVEN_105086-1 [Araneus ventricosus]